MALLEVRGISAGYGPVQALQAVSLEVHEGEIVAVLGANGAGKSTTLRTISGLLRPRNGEIRFGGHSIGGLPAYQIVRMGIVHIPEGRRIFGGLTVRDNLELGGYTRSSPAERRSGMEQVFTLFPRLHERREQLAGTLSGGEQQMLSIGRGLMASPRLLMLDEPSLGLSPILVQAIMATIREINRRGTTVLLVEQNARAALSLARRGYVVETGRVVMEGPASSLSQNERVIKAYLGE